MGQVEPFSQDKQSTLIACHEHAFTWFGGIPEGIFYDNPKTIVLDRATAKARLNPRLEDYCRYYGYTPRLSRPYRVHGSSFLHQTPDSIFPSRYPLTRKTSLKKKQRTGLIRSLLTHLWPKGGDFAATLS